MTCSPDIRPSFQSLLFGPIRQPGRESACAFMNGPLAVAFRLQRRRESTAALRNNEVPTPPKKPRAFPQLYYLTVLFMLQRIENEYLAVGTKSVCAD